MRGLTPKLTGGLAGAKRRQDRPVERLVGLKTRLRTGHRFAYFRFALYTKS